MTKLIHCITTGLWVFVPGLQVSAQEMASLHHVVQDGGPMTEGLLLVFVLFAALTLCAAVTDGLKRGAQRQPFVAAGKAGRKIGKATQSDNLFWRGFSIKRSAMVRLTGCMAVAFVLLGSAPGAIGQTPDEIQEFLNSALVGDLGKLKTMVANGMDVNAQATEKTSPFRLGTTALHVAANGNHLAMVNFLMSKGANPGIANVNRVTPLHMAAERGYAAIATALLKADSGVLLATIAKDARGRTPLHLAVVSDGDTVTALLEAGANVYAKDNDGRTPLQYGKSKADAKGLAVLTTFLDYMVYYFVEAATLDNIPKLKRLLLNGIDIDAQNGGGNNLIKGITALHGAATSPQLEAVQFLLGRGANPNISDSEGKTPLHRAAENGRASIVTTLLEAGANVHATDKGGKTPQQLAQNKGHASLAAKLLDFARALPANLRTAVDNGDASLIRRLIKNGVDVNAKNHRGDTELHHAVRKTSRAAVTINALLTATDINMDAKNNDGLTPLHIAAEFDLTEAIKALLAGGADADSQANIGGDTPMMLAALYGRTAAVKALLAGGADAKGTDHYGGTALHVAAYWGRTDIIPLLLKSGADVNAKNARGQTPLHRASSVGRTAVVKALLAAGADVDARDEKGRTAQQYALENGHTSIAPLLGDYVPPAPQKLWDAIKADDPDEVRRLIRLGVDVNAWGRGVGAFPALYRILHSSKDPNLEIVHLLMANGADATLTIINNWYELYRAPALLVAARFGHLAAAELILAYDATLVTLGDPRNQTALHLAAQQGDRALVELLVAYWPDVLDSGNGAQIDPNNPPDREASISNRYGKDGDGKTPRQLALDKGHKEVAEALNGLEAFVRKAALHRVITDSDDPDLVEDLLDQGASVETRSNLLANTPLHTAVLANRTAVARFLLTEGASTEARNASGDTPLHFAALTANADMAAILLDNGADPDARNVHGKTPLHYATSMGAKDVEQELLDAGADATIKDWDENTPYENTP